MPPQAVSLEKNRTMVLGMRARLLFFYAIELPLDHEWAIARSRTRLFTPRSNERVLKTEGVTMPVQTKKVIRGIVAVGVTLAVLAVFAALIGLIPLSSP